MYKCICVCYMYVCVYMCLCVLHVCMCIYGLPLVAQLVKNPPEMQETWVRSLVGKIPWRRKRVPTPVFWPGEFYGLYSPWGLKESDMTE